jgi:hypothetical protein
MARAISIFGLGGVFVLVSPTLRLDISDGIAASGHWMNLYSPYSYIAATIGIFALLTLFMHRSGNH